MYQKIIISFIFILTFSSENSDLRGRHLKASSDFSKKVPYFKNFLEHLPFINFGPVSEFSLENVNINMKLVVKSNFFKYADNLIILSYF